MSDQNKDFSRSLFFRPRTRLQKVSVVLLLAWPFLAWAAAKFLIVRAPIEHADAIVLLSGSSSYKERAHRAAELFEAGKAPRVILTNDGQQGSWSNELQRNPFYYESTLAELNRLGVPRENVDVLMEPVSNTYEEALLVRNHVEKRQIRSILVVTSAYHSRRSLWTYRRLMENTGVTVGLEAAPVGWQTPSPWVWWYRARGWQIVPTEYFKLMYYRFRF